MYKLGSCIDKFSCFPLLKKNCIGSQLGRKVALGFIAMACIGIDSHSHSGRCQVEVHNNYVGRRDIDTVPHYL